MESSNDPYLKFQKEQLLLDSKLKKDHPKKYAHFLWIKWNRLSPEQRKKYET